MDIFYIFIIILILFSIYYYYNYEETFKNKYCYGNVFCGNNDFCLFQRCLKCGLRAQCKTNKECGPNKCINGCCDNM